MSIVPAKSLRPQPIAAAAKVRSAADRSFSPMSRRTTPSGAARARPSRPRWSGEHGRAVAAEDGPGLQFRAGDDDVGHDGSLDGRAGGVGGRSTCSHRVCCGRARIPPADPLLGTQARPARGIRHWEARDSDVACIEFAVGGACEPGESWVATRRRSRAWGFLAAWRGIS